VRRIPAVAVIAMTLVLSLAACQLPAAHGQIRTLSAAPLLADAVRSLNADGFTFTLDAGEDQLKGSFDAVPTDQVASSVDNVILLVEGNDVYIVRLDDQDKWLHMDVSKIPSDSPKLLLADVLFGWRLLATARHVKRDGSGSFRGVYDLTKAPGDQTSPIKRLADRCVAGAGVNASAIPFVASVNSERRLVRLQTTFPKFAGGKDMRYDLRIDGVGNVNRMLVPQKSKVVEAPAQAYRD
jgi:hypothetical protein